MRRSIAALTLAATALSGCPLFRSSTSPEEACRKSAAIMGRCATAESPKWDQARTEACVYTLRTFAATPEGRDGFMAAQLRDCNAAVNRPAPRVPRAGVVRQGAAGAPIRAIALRRIRVPTNERQKRTTDATLGAARLQEWHGTALGSPLSAAGHRRVITGDRLPVPTPTDARERNDAP